MSEDVVTLAVGLGLLALSVLNGRWDAMTVVDADKPPIFAEVDREADELRDAWRRRLQRARTVFLAGSGALFVLTAVVRLAVSALRG